jgi:RNA polymerase sigma factor (sigma-70 family)
MEKWPQIDDVVLTALRNGDKNAYATIYRMYYSRLYNYGFKFTENTALVEDVIQEILTTFWINREKIKEVESFESYLFVSFRNRLIKGLQEIDLTTESISHDEYRFEFELSIDQVLINADRLYEQQTNLKSALKQLTERQKEAIYFKFYENMSYQQIAAILDISVKATYKLVARAIIELRFVYQQKTSHFIFVLSFSSAACFI